MPPWLPAGTQRAAPLLEISHSACATDGISVSQPAGGVFCMICQNDVSTGTLDASEDLNSGAFFVEPTILRGSFDHGVFAADVIRRDRDRELLADAGDDIEIRQCG